MSNAMKSTTAKQRARLYRERAAELVHRAQDAPDEELRSTFLNLAAGWQDLATLLERRPVHDSAIGLRSL